MFQVNIDSRQLRKLDAVLRTIKGGVPKVLAPAINRTLDKGRTEVRRGIRKVYLIKQKDIPIKVRGANVLNLTGAVTIKDKMLELGKFKVSPPGVQKRKTKKVIHAQVKRGGGGNISYAFNIASFGGYVGPYARKGKERLPIKKLLTISAPIMAAQANVGPAVNKAMGDTLAKRLDHELKRVMASAGGH